MLFVSLFVYLSICLFDVIQWHLLLQQFFEEMQFESVAESYLKKMQEMANEDKKGGEATANYDDIVSHVTGRLRNLMEVAEKLKKKLDEAINRWTVFETEKSDVEIWMDEKEQTLSGVHRQTDRQTD